MMDKKINPFTVIFGIEPQSIIPRINDYSQIISVFENDKPRTYAYVITGVRGSGKTVLMTSVQRYFAEKNDWIVLRLNPDIDLYESAISQLDEYVSFSKDKISEVNVSIAGFGGGMSVKSLSNNETLLRKMLKVTTEKKKRVLVVIDEASNTENLKTFAHSYQAFIGEGLQVFLLMTSLPENFVSLSNSTNGTFLKRMPKITLGRLNDTMIKNAYADIFDVSVEQAAVLTDIVCGYSFAYQVLGDLLWEAGLKEPNEKIMRDFDAILDDCVYSPIWDHLTAKEKTVVAAIGKSKEGTVKSVRDILGMESNEFSPYREALINEGIIDTSTYGKVSFTLPRFMEFVEGKTITP